MAISILINANRSLAGLLAGSLHDSLPAAHRQTLSAKRTTRNSASMHSVLAARNILFLAPLRSPPFRRVLQRLVVSHSPANIPAKLRCVIVRHEVLWRSVD